VEEEERDDAAAACVGKRVTARVAGVQSKYRGVVWEDFSIFSTTFGRY
jgi:hypothetical protein